MDFGSELMLEDLFHAGRAMTVIHGLRRLAVNDEGIEQFFRQFVFNKESFWKKFPAKSNEWANPPMEKVDSFLMSLLSGSRIRHSREFLCLILPFVNERRFFTVEVYALSPEFWETFYILLEGDRAALPNFFNSYKKQLSNVRV